MSRYAQVSDLGVLSLPPATLQNIPVNDQQAQLDVASGEVDSYLRSQFRLPLLSWGIELTAAVCAIAAFKLMAHRGYNPQTGANETIRMMRDDAIQWLDRVSKGIATPEVVESLPPAQSTSRVYSNPPRGWDRMP